MPRTNPPLPERAPTARVEGRTIGLHRCPDLWIGGIAAVMGGSAWAYDRHWQAGALVGLVSWSALAFIYPLPAWLFGWPQVRWVDVVTNGIDLLDVVVGLLPIFS